MILIRKNAAPLKFTRYCGFPQASFDDMDKDAKDALRKSLVEEQGGICAYCMKRIRDDNTTKIEHYIHRNPDNELDYNNLLAVCSGNMGEPYYKQTCDTRKGNKDIYINPQDENHIKNIWYKRDGSIGSNDKKADDDLNNLLNLNCEQDYLKRNRKEALEKLIQCLSTLDSKQSAETMLRKLEKKYDSLFPKEEYVGIILYYIHKYLRQYE